MFGKILLDDNGMEKYVKFISEFIPKRTMCTLYKNINKGDEPYYIPLNHVQAYVDLVIKNISKRTLTIEVTFYFCSKEKEIMLSRHKSPHAILETIRGEVQTMFNQIVIENNLDVEKIEKSYSIFRYVNVEEWNRVFQNSKEKLKK